MPPMSPSMLLRSPESGGWEQENVFSGSCFQTVITVHVCVCVCAPLLPGDRDRWIGSHHIYQGKQFMEARRGRAGTRLNSAFKSQPSIWAEASGSRWLRSRFVREDEPAGDKAAARGFVVPNQESWCRRSAGMQTNDRFRQSGSEN